MTTEKKIKVPGGTVTVTTSFNKTPETFETFVNQVYIGALHLENSFYTENKPGKISTRRKNEIIRELNQAIRDIKITIKKLEEA